MAEGPDHQAAAERADAQARGQERTYNLIAVLRVLCFVVLCVALAGLVAGNGAPALAVAAAAMGGFLALALWHLTIDDRRRVARQLAIYHQRGAERMRGSWQHGQDDGAAQAPGDHAYAGDLDVVGPGGLYQLLNTAGSQPGRQRLADWLLDRRPPPADVESRVRVLRDHHAWRAALATAAHDEVELGREDPLATWLGARGRAPGRGAVVAIWSVRVVVPVLLAGAYIQVGGAGLFWAALVLMGLLYPVDGLARRRSAAIDPVGSRLRVRALARALRVIGELPASDDGSLREVRAAACDAREGAERLARLCADLAQGANAVRAGLGALMLSEWATLRRLHRWALEHGADYADWCDLLAEAEATACVATYAAEQGGVWAEPVVGDEIVHAEDLAHPLLPREQRVGNDLALHDGQVLLLTGANASGKSTFLRAVALAAVLMRIGAPAPARRLRLCPLRVATVMRVGDDLRAGRSRFQAEVERLRDMLDLSAVHDEPVLLAFDEILAGTNSQERHLGTKAVLDALRGRHGVVLVSTHDLDLVRLAEAEPERFVVAHFADRAALAGEEVEGPGDMVFDYQLRPGVLQTTNALRVMRAYGLPVDGVAAESGERPDSA